MARRTVATWTFAALLAAGAVLGILDRHRPAPAVALAQPATPVRSGPADTVAADIRSAERNLYPSPETALQLADRLGLTQEQRQDLRAVQIRAETEMDAIGRRLLTEERRLDFAFAQANVSSGRIDAITAQIGTLQGSLRAARLRGHIAAHDLMTAEQLLHYAELRGFQPSPPDLFDDLDRDAERRERPVR